MKLGPGEKTIVLMAGFVIVIAGLEFAQPLLVPLFLAMVIATLSMPVIRWLTSKRVPRFVAIIIAVLLDLGVLVGMGALIRTSTIDFYQALPGYHQRLTLFVQQIAEWLDGYGLHVSSELYARLTNVGGLMDLITNLLRSVAGIVGNTLLVLVLVVFILFEVGRWELKIGYALGDPRTDLRRFSRAVYELQKYLLVKSGTNLFTGGVCAAWIALWDVDFALLWALLTFLLNYIPTVGSIIASVPPVLVALLQHGPGTALVVLIGLVVMNLLIGSVVEPRIMGRALGLSPLVVILSMVFWGYIWGPIGVLLSAPLTLMVKIALAHTNDLRWAAILLGSARWVEDTYAKQYHDQQKPVPIPAQKAEAPPKPVSTIEPAE